MKYFRARLAFLAYYDFANISLVYVFSVFTLTKNESFVCTFFVPVFLARFSQNISLDKTPSVQKVGL